MPAAKPTALWDRVLRASKSDLTPQQIAQFLNLRFGKEDQARVRQLGQRAQLGRLTADDEAELDEYLTIGQVLTTIRALAQQHLGVRPKAAAKTPATRRRKAS